MSVDVTVEAFIQRPCPDVYAFAVAPENATTWYVNVERMSLLTPPPLAVGSRIDFLAVFLTKRLRYTYEVTALEPDTFLQMRAVDAPFPMTTEYRFSPKGHGTQMSIRNYGQPQGVFRLAGSLMQMAMRLAVSKDLQRLKQVLER